jgi:hypothetical protein
MKIFTLAKNCDPSPEDGGGRFAGNVGNYLIFYGVTSQNTVNVIFTSMRPSNLTSEDAGMVVCYSYPMNFVLNCSSWSLPVKEHSCRE